MIRTFEQLEIALDNHRAARLHRLTLAAIASGNVTDARHFAAALTSHCNETLTDMLAFGDEPQLLADIRDERTFALAA
jgi:hypothetical protein